MAAALSPWLLRVPAKALMDRMDSSRLLRSMKMVPLSDVT